ncbi:helix-turn-helix domain-containing protein [Acinetobacter pittii]|uniref:helix-turn-helix domain-containing protein n=1 Tax=Acinetobacter pittii TaxID=48296 RepID=UPI001F45768C|nr:helix-turn-helix domain-containing protein [Acinetobacter pittii]
MQQLIDSGASLVSTNDAATVLGYKPNTLRVWASRGCGDLTPVMTKNGARWRLTDIRNLVGA